jgi:hypothetical protein
MNDVAATSFLRGAGKAGRRFVAEVAVSSVATLCVTLALSSGLRHDLSGTRDDTETRIIAQAPGPASMLAAPDISAGPSGAAASQVRVIEIEPQAANDSRPQGAQATPHNDDKAAVVASEALVSPAPLISPAPPAPPRGRASHAPKSVAAKPKDVSPNCVAGCDGRLPVMAAANARDAVPAAYFAPQPVAAGGWVPERAHRVFGMAIPTLSVPPVVIRSAGPVVQGANVVAGLLSGLVGAP